MAEVAPAPAVAPAKTAKKKNSTPRRPGTSVSELIVKAVAASKERSGVSAAALKKNLAAGGYDVDKNKSRVKTAIKTLVAKGTLVQTTGTGASGSFKMSKKATEPKTKKSVKKAAPKVKKVAVKKTAAAKKPKTVLAGKKPVAAKKAPKKAAKKSATTKKTVKSPKKISKPKSPKKVVRKAPAAKKAPAKKAVKPKVKKAAPKKK